MGYERDKNDEERNYNQANGIKKPGLEGYRHFISEIMRLWIFPNFLKIQDWYCNFVDRKL